MTALEDPRSLVEVLGDETDAIVEPGPSPYSKVATAFGFTVCADDKGEIDTAEVTFFVEGPEDRVGVVMWSGSYPFPVDHDMGVLPSMWEAVSYADWLLKREAFYADRDTRLWEESQQDQPGG